MIIVNPDREREAFPPQVLFSIIFSVSELIQSRQCHGVVVVFFAFFTLSPSSVDNGTIEWRPLDTDTALPGDIRRAPIQYKPTRPTEPSLYRCLDRSDTEVGVERESFCPRR